MAESKDLLQVLWSGADVLRGKMDANEYKTKQSTTVAEVLKVLDRADLIHAK